MDKASLRQILQRKRSAHSPQRVRSDSLLITASFVANIPGNVSTVHVYAPLFSLHEVDTTPLVEAISEHYAEAKIDIGLASASAPLPIKSYDVVVVPLLGFDRNLTRLGYGGGWYDQFLARQDTAIKVGVAFDAQFVSSLPAEPHDIALDMVITPTKVWVKP